MQIVINYAVIEIFQGSNLFSWLSHTNLLYILFQILTNVSSTLEYVVQAPATTL